MPWVSNEHCEFHRACNRLLNQETFDEYLEKEMYTAYKEITNSEKSKACFNCIYYDKTKFKCLHNDNIKEKMKACYNAKKIYILKRNNIYGTKGVKKCQDEQY